MEITPSNLNMLFRGFNTAFQTGTHDREAASLYARITTHAVPRTSATKLS